MPAINCVIYKAFMGDTENTVPRREIPIHFWRIQATQALRRVQDGDDGTTITAIIGKEQRLLRKYTINMCYEELILNNPRNSILNRILKQRKVSSEYRQLIISKIAEFAQSMTMPTVRPIFIIMSDLVTYSSRQVMDITIQEFSNRELNSTVVASRAVPATKSSIDKLEKVKTKVDGLCSVCFEEFEDGAEETTRMPCSHVYHTNCIEKWLKYNHVCPLCRFEMPKSIN